MTESTADATLELLRRMRAESTEQFSSIAARFDKVDKNIGLLADGLINMRVEMKNLTASIDTLSIATASHGRQLADLDDRMSAVENRIAGVEDRMGRIEKHLNIPQ